MATTRNYAKLSIVVE